MYMPQLTETVRTVRKDHAAHIKGDSRPLPADQPVHTMDGTCAIRGNGEQIAPQHHRSAALQPSGLKTIERAIHRPPGDGMTQTRDGRRKLGLGPGRMRYKLAHPGIQCRIKGLPRGRHAMLPEPVREIKRARQYQQIMIRQRFIENTPRRRGGTSRFFHAHAYAENTSDIIVVGRTAMSRTRHRTPPPDHCHGCHSSHATHAIDMRTKQGGSSNRDVIPEGRQRPGQGRGGIGVHTRQPPTPPAGGLQRQRDLTQDQAQQDEIATYQNLDRRLDHNGRDGPCPHTSLTRRLFCVTILP